MTCYISKPGDGGSPRIPGWGWGGAHLAWLQNEILCQQELEVLVGSAGWGEVGPTQAWSRGPGGATLREGGDRERHGEYTEVEKQSGWERAGRGNARRDQKKKKGKTFKREKDVPVEKPDSGFWRERCPGNSGREFFAELDPCY